MKNLFLLALVVFGTTLATAQNKDTKYVVKNSTVNIQQRPAIWPGCAEPTNNGNRTCFNKMLIKHIIANYPKSKIEKPGRVVVSLTVLKDGDVRVDKVEGGSAATQKHARAIMNKIPKLEPSIQDGQPRNWSMKVPITFK